MSISLSAGSFEFIISDPLITIDGKYLCVASFHKMYTVISTAISFVLPGVLIILANIGIVVLGGNLLRRDRKRSAGPNYWTIYFK